MHYDLQTIKEMGEDIGGGYVHTTLRLEPGDTAFAPGTTKYNLLAHGRGGTVEYLIHPSSVTGTIIEGQVARSLIDPNG